MVAVGSGISHRSLPVGAEARGTHGTHFRVWAPRHGQVAGLARGRTWSLLPKSPWSRNPADTSPRWWIGRRLGCCIASGWATAPSAFPIPASRFQPDGPHGPSEIVDPERLRLDRRGVDRRVARAGRSSTRCTSARSREEGTWRAAIEQLPALRELGITRHRDDAGRRVRRPLRLGLRRRRTCSRRRSCTAARRPPPLRRARARARASASSSTSSTTTSARTATTCGSSRRRYFIEPLRDRVGRGASTSTATMRRRSASSSLANAGYWIDEFHLDGLRLDATQQIFDASRDARPGRRSRARRARRRRRASILLVAENEPQDVAPAAARRARAATASTRLWNDDFHHAASVALTGRREAYYTDYLGTPQEFAVAGEVGIPVSGPAVLVAEERRGTPALGLSRRSSSPSSRTTIRSPTRHRPRRRTASGRQSRALPRADRAVAAVARDADVLPGPGVASSSPFLYFADHGRSSRAAVRAGRAEFLSSFRAWPRGISSTRCPILLTRRHSPVASCDHAERQAHTAAVRPPPRPAAAAPRGSGLRARARLDRRRGPRHRGVRPAMFARSRGPWTGSPAIGCWSSISGLICISFRAGAAACAARQHALGDPLVERGSGVRRRGTPPLDTDEGWRIPGQATVVLAARRGMSLPFRLQSPAPSADPAAYARAVNGSSPMASAAMPPAPSPASSRAGTTGCSSSALPAPIGRTVMLSAVDACALRPAGSSPWNPISEPAASAAGGRPSTGKAGRHGDLETMSLAEFRLEAGLPVWRYEGERTGHREARR